MKIAIVEDDIKCMQQLQDYILKFQGDFQRKLETTHFSNGILFLNQFKGQYDIILLDISMPGIDGLETAHRIRKIDSDVVIIFITNLSQYAIRGYEVDATDYILKPVSYFAFSQRLNRAISRIPICASRSIIINHKTGTQKIKLDSIYYIESVCHDLIYHTMQGEYISVGTMKDVEAELSAYHFFRCNKGLLVSLLHVDGVTDGCAIVNGKHLPISRPRKNGFMDALANYIGGTI